MKEQKVITMKSEMKTTDQEHICSESEEVSFNFDDDDNLSDVDYDSDDMNNLPELKDVDGLTTELSSKLPRRIKKSTKRSTKNNNYLDDDEEEYSEEEDDNDYSFNDDDEDRKIRHRLYLRGQNEKYANTLEKLSILDGKLNWLEKMSFDNTTDLQHSNEKEYPAIDEFVDVVKRTHLSSRKTSPTGIKYHPTDHIKIVIGKSTFIGLKSNVQKSNALCKFIANGAECKLGDQCRFSHEQIKKLCNSVKEGKECKFGNRCKFMHQIETNGRNQKPDCKYGMKCLNNKCTFIHPNGPNGSGRRTGIGRTGIGRIYHQQRFNLGNSPEQQKSKNPREDDTGTHFIPKSDESSIGDDEVVVLRKIWLCKNMFKIITDEISVKIEEFGICKFGDRCIYAHSRQDIQNALQECIYKDKCNAVKLVYIIKDGKRVRRYKNNPEIRKCNRLHPNERIFDFISRIQHQPLINP